MKPRVRAILLDVGCCHLPQGCMSWADNEEFSHSWTNWDIHMDRDENGQWTCPWEKVWSYSWKGDRQTMNYKGDEETMSKGQTETYKGL